MTKLAGPLATIALLLSAVPSVAADPAGQAPSGACSGSVDLSTVTPADASGSTFVGVYLGDVIGGRDDAAALSVSWALETVFAGGPLPEDLVFQTPACAWANLTPGSRYLFSTATTGLGSGLDSSAAPDVSDSLAWELLSDGGLQLAPFDTYSVNDYEPSVSAIDTLDGALAALSVSTDDAEPPAGPSSIDYACTAALRLPSLEDAMDTVFTGRFIGSEKLDSGAVGIRDVRLFWSVSKVYSGGPLPEVMTMRSRGCHPVTLKPGVRYLFATADAVAPSSEDSLAWRVKGDGTIVLAPASPVAKVKEYGADVRSVSTLADALDTIAPGSGEGMDPARSGDRTPG